GRGCPRQATWPFGLFFLFDETKPRPKGHATSVSLIEACRLRTPRLKNGVLWLLNSGTSELGNLSPWPFVPATREAWPSLAPVPSLTCHCRGLLPLSRKPFPCRTPHSSIPKHEPQRSYRQSRRH